MEHCSQRCHYFFLLKKCSASDCSKCGPPILPADEFAPLHPFPDPMPVLGQDRYKPFAAVWGTATSEEYRPSLQTRREHSHIRTTADTDNCVLALKCETVRDYVLCTECQRPRCLFSAKKLSLEQAAQVATAQEETDYVCGRPLFSSQHPLVHIVGTRADIDCSTHVTSQYYSCKRGFSPVCYSCGGKNPCPVPEDILCQHQTVHPVCAACQSKGVQLRTRGKKKMGQ